jgi:DUF4097 and DUF4098 domain-containing protein YvlB
MNRLACTVVLLFICATSSRAQQGRGDGNLVWSKRMPAGSIITVRNGDGFIHVSESTSDRVEVRATKSRGAARTATFDVDESGDGVTICTLYERQTSCRDRNRSGRTSVVRVDYTVLVPLDVRVNVNTGNGEITVDRAGGEVSASTGKGRVFIATARGPVRASTGAGDVDVRLQSSAGDAGVDVVTGSGSIRLSVPSDFNGEIDAQSGNGALRSDFDITVMGRLDATHIRGTIGRGGSRLHLQTGNGRIELRKS